LSLWFFYSPNPTNASNGWFHQSVVQPATVVPAAYQWDFLMPKQHETSEISGNEHEQHVLPGESSEAKAIETSAAEHGGGHSYANKFQEELHHFHNTAMILSLLIAGFGILLAFMIYQFKIISADKLASRLKPLHQFSYNKWYFDELYKATAIGGTLVLAKALSWFDTYIVDGMVNLSSYLTRGFGFFVGLFDNYVIDGIVNLTANVTGYCGNMIRKLQTGSVQAYVAFALLGLLIIIYFFI